MNNDTIKDGDAMSRNEPTGARRRRRTKTAAWLGVAGLCATGAALAPLNTTGHAQAASESEGMVCTDGSIGSNGHRQFNLTATDGYTSEPDGNAIYDWGYTANGDVFQLPGPVMCINQGETVDVILTNELAVATSIQFPGQEGVTYDDGLTSGPVGPVANPAGDLLALVQEAPPATSIAYTFTATNAGTYVYESGSDPQLQVQMGLFGSIVVRPTYQGAAIVISPEDIQAIPADGPTGVTTNADRGMTLADATAVQADAACAYASTTDPSKCDPLAIYNGNRENILMLSEIDPGLHSFMEQNKTDATKFTWNAYPGAYAAHYFMINGRSMPDTLAPNNAGWMPSQPYGAMAHVQPWDARVNPLDIMLRYVGVGVTGYDFHPHSNHEHVIAEDGALMKGTTTATAATGNDNTEEKFNIMVAPGSTVDATFRWTNEEGYSDTSDGSKCGNTNIDPAKGTGCRLPATWPEGLNLKEGDFWSGSPYLGESGQLNAGILTKTQCGEYYHVAHSHDLTQATNYGITFGGMLTLIKVEPPDSAQAAMHLDCNG